MRMLFTSSLYVFFFQKFYCNVPTCTTHLQHPCPLRHSHPISSHLDTAVKFPGEAGRAARPRKISLATFSAIA